MKTLMRSNMLWSEFIPVYMSSITLYLNMCTHELVIYFQPLRCNSWPVLRCMVFSNLSLQWDQFQGLLTGTDWLLSKTVAAIARAVESFLHHKFNSISFPGTFFLTKSAWTSVSPDQSFAGLCVRFSWGCLNAATEKSTVTAYHLSQKTVITCHRSKSLFSWEYSHEF